MGRSPCCEKAHTTKGGWTTEEDCQLVGYILAHGVGCWRSLPKAAGLRRSGKSCRSRWMNYLRPDIKRGNFTEEEVELIIKLHSLLGNRWSLIASRLPGRTDNEIKNQWNTRIRRKFLSLGIDPTTHRPIYKPPQEVKGDGSRSPTKIESSQIGRIMQLDSSCQESIRVPDHINGAYLVSVDQDVFAGARKQGQENISTKQDIGANYVPHSLPQQSIVVDDMNGERVIRTKQDNANGSRKQGKIWTLDREYGISREVLEQYSEKKLKDVAVILGVSRSTLKRICRKYHIFRWPPCKAKRFGPSVNPQASIHVTQRQIEDQSLIDQSLHDLPLDGQDTSSIIVKATYGDDMLKFQLSLSSRKLDLEEQVAMRLNLSVGSFKIKYLDEDEDWVLVACDADLRACMSTLRLLGKTTIKMQIC